MKSRNQQRRKLIKLAAISGGVVGASGLTSEKWVKPIITSVITPAHAQTTEVISSDPIVTTTTTAAPLRKYFTTGMGSSPLVNQINFPSNSIADKGAAFVQAIGNVLIPTAQAGNDAFIVAIYLEQLFGDTYDFVLQHTGLSSNSSDVFRSEHITGQLIANGGGTSLPYTDCEGSGTATVSLFNVIPGTSADISVSLLDGPMTFTLNEDANATRPVGVMCNNEPQ